MASKTVQHLLLLMVRGKDRSLAPQQVDVAAEASAGILGDHIQLRSKMIEFLGVERPGVAFRCEDR